MKAINKFLLKNRITIRDNPCVSPDFCLDWESLSARLRVDTELKGFTPHGNSRLEIAAGRIILIEDAAGEHAWILDTTEAAEHTGLLADGVALGASRLAFPATWENLLRLKNLIQESDPLSTVFPVARGTLKRASIGVGARFTTLHWPAVEWVMAKLGVSLTANQNSIPRELVYDVDAMLENRLTGILFPFIGGEVPEGHQGQSVEGMSHGAVISKLKTGFHRHRIDWGFNADHQPIGGRFDAREDRLVAGSLLAGYITFDLSPELSQTAAIDDPGAWCIREIDAALIDKVRRRVAAAGVALDSAAFHALLASVWPAVLKMKRRDEKYAAARRNAFTTEAGRAYFRELSIDELPGLTTPGTLATMLALCEALDMPVRYVAPAFGFQKNCPFPDSVELERRVSAAWEVCHAFGVSIGFHSGSGKSAENYRLCAAITGGALEIKTSGRYTYEMGRSLAASDDPADRALWLDWWTFTRDIALNSAFGENETERSMARSFITASLAYSGVSSADAFSSETICRDRLNGLTPDPEHMFWFEYNFLYVLAAGGRPEKGALGDHTPAGYAQRRRFYAIGESGRFGYSRLVAEYLLFLCETCGFAPSEKIALARADLAQHATHAGFLADIAPAVGKPRVDLTR